MPFSTRTVPAPGNERRERVVRRRVVEDDLPGAIAERHRRRRQRAGRRRRRTCRGADAACRPPGAGKTTSLDWSLRRNVLDSRHADAGTENAGDRQAFRGVRSTSTPLVLRELNRSSQRSGIPAAPPFGCSRARGRRPRQLEANEFVPDTAHHTVLPGCEPIADPAVPAKPLRMFSVTARGRVSRTHAIRSPRRSSSRPPDEARSPPRAPFTSAPLPETPRRSSRSSCLAIPSEPNSVCDHAA